MASRDTFPACPPATGSTPGASSPGSLVAEELGRLARLMQSFKTHSATPPRGLEWATYMVLMHLVKHGPQRSKALADLLHSDPSTVSRQASALVDLGLVDRESDPADRRAVQLAATDAGRQLFDEVRQQRVRMLDRVLEHWSTDEAEELAGLLRRFTHDFEAYVGAPAAAHSSPHGPPEGAVQTTTTGSSGSSTQQEST